jgi:hypothetical protein
VGSALADHGSAPLQWHRHERKAVVDLLDGLQVLETGEPVEKGLGMSL